MYQQLKALSHGFADLAIVVHLVRTMILLPIHPSIHRALSSDIVLDNLTIGHLDHLDIIWAHFASQASLVQQMVPNSIYVSGVGRKKETSIDSERERLRKKCKEIKEYRNH